MTFDIVTYTEEELEHFSAVQMQILRTAQKKKDELQHKMEQELEMFKKMIMGNGMTSSTLYKTKKFKLRQEFNYQVEILREQLLYSIKMNEPLPTDEEKDQALVGYLVDYSLMYADRYAIVREYYMGIADPELRMKKYSEDQVAERYLGGYYSVLYNVLYSYSRT